MYVEVALQCDTKIEMTGLYCMIYQHVTVIHTKGIVVMIAIALYTMIILNLALTGRVHWEM